ncbi:13850_t:CDS:1, partial [Cetraspora pellucida]
MSGKWKCREVVVEKMLSGNYCRRGFVGEKFMSEKCRRGNIFRGNRRLGSGYRGNVR